ncbi:MAG: CRISPR-associated helicase Cas3' [Bacteroidaceae bacterium]
MKFIAHTKNSNGSIKIQTLQEHLESTAQIAGDFAAQFDSRDWGEIIGLWHDIGKIQPNFQQFIKQESKLLPFKRKFSTIERAHAKIGAVALYQLLPPQFSLPMAYCIEGHHSGMANWFAELEDKITNLECWTDISEMSFLPKPMGSFSFPKFTKPEEQLHQWVRMLFSTLVDADRLDTERFANAEQAATRSKYESLETLKGKLDDYLKKIESRPSTPLNKQRSLILAQCRNKGCLSTGFFSMSVPTGGGKTLSSMAWALNHAIKHGKKRIIVAIPYTSIITQNAAIFREIFGANNVLEHHSNLSEQAQSEINENSSLRLSMENWDVPIVVTTNVQLFESLHSNRPSVCRKIHNITNSVLIIDEAQMLPVEFLRPILQSLEGLVDLFHTSILFTTATQPVFTGQTEAGENRFQAIKSPIRELIEKEYTHHLNFKRTTLHAFSIEQNITPEFLAVELSKHKQVLCIVNTRAEAQQLCQFMPVDTIHLSRNMYSRHLMKQILKIRELLSKGKEVRVISTQLIEAGVDVDFPIVYRAMAGLDSIIQAAGRCNREGNSPNGDVFIFKWKGERLQGLMAQGEAVVKDLLYDHTFEELSTPEMLNLYFEKFYKRIEQMDKPQTKELLIRDALHFRFQFAKYAENFRLIDDKDSESFLIPNEEGKVLYDKMQAGQMFTLADYRAVQQYSVSVPKSMAFKLKEQRAIDERFEIKVLASSFYDPLYGVVVDGRWIDEFIYI